MHFHGEWHNKRVIGNMMRIDLNIRRMCDDVIVSTKTLYIAKDSVLSKIANEEIGMHVNSANTP